jgi:hypothetical protein
LDHDEDVMQSEHSKVAESPSSAASDVSSSARHASPSSRLRLGMRLVVESFNRSFFRERTVVGAVAFRVALSLWTILFLAPRLPHAGEIYARPVLRQVSRPWHLLGDPVPPVWAAELAIVVAIVLCLVFAFTRRHARLVHVALLIPLSFLFAIDTVMPRAYGGLAHLQWWLLFLAPYDRAIDDDGRLMRAPPVGMRLLMLQFCAVYFFAVFSKLLDGGGWVDGSAVYNAFNSERYGRFLLSSWRMTRELAPLLSWGTIVGEGFVAVALLVPRLRLMGILTIVFLHVGMALSLRVSPLFHVLMISHLVLFFPDAWWVRILRTLGVRVVDAPVPATKSEEVPA